MTTVIRAIYNGKINPLAKPIDENSGYHELAQEISGLADTIHTKLNEPEQKLLNDFMDSQGLAANLSCEDRFVSGFILGARLMLEILTTPNDGTLNQNQD